MAIAKWFGGTTAVEDPKTNTPVVEIITSADAKKFGLENLSNTCYANSVIQALYFCAPFRELLLIQSDPSAILELPPLPPPVIPPPTPATTRKKPERKPSVAGAPGEPSPAAVAAIATYPPIPGAPPSLFSALRSLFVHISKNPADKGTVSPRAFIDKLKELNELFRSNMHQDAHEFLNYLLNKIVEEIEEEKKLHGTSEDLSASIATLPPTITTSLSSNSGTSPQDATLVHTLFEGILTSETRCLTCETISSRDESFLDLSIDIEQNSSVTACLRQFSASEMLCQKNKFFCDSCCDLQEAEKRMKIKKLPNVLALHLKRFKYQEDVQKYVKLAYRVAFPFELRLFNTVDNSENPDRLYELFAIVVHIGNGPHHGHYVSIIKTMGQWFIFDDETVDVIKESEISKYFGDSNSGSAYVLYYQAADIDMDAIGVRHPPPTAPAQAAAPAEAPASPMLPPGLIHEEEDSDISDPPFPITPSLVSQASSFVVEKPSKHPLKVNITQPDEGTFSVASTPTVATPGGSSTKGSLFGYGSLRHASIKGRASKNSSEHRRSRTDFEEEQQSTVPPMPALNYSAPTPTTAAKPPVSPRKEPERKKSTGWFARRKSVKLEKSLSENTPDLSPSPTKLHPRDDDFTSAAGAWPTGPPRKENGHSNVRRPSEPGTFESSRTVTGTRPQSMAGPPKTNGHHHHGHGFEPPASASAALPPPVDFPRTIVPPQRPSTAAASVPRTSHHRPGPSLDHVKSTPDLVAVAASPPLLSPRPLPASPAVSPFSGVVGARTESPTPLFSPPVSPFSGQSDGGFVHVEAEKGKSRDTVGDLPPSRASVNTSATGTSGSSAGLPPAPTSTPSSGLRKATRKLSLSSPLLGFGRKDKDKTKDKAAKVG